MTTADPARGVCVVGSINIDTTYRVPHIPLPGETLLAQGRTGSQGGKGANQAAAAARLGSQVTFIGCTGEDADGVRATASLRRLGVDVTQVRALPGASTGTALVLVSADGENVVVVDAGANQRMDPVVVAEGVSSGAHRVVLAQLETTGSPHEYRPCQPPVAAPGASRPRPPHADTTAGPVTLPRAALSEWVKFRTLRSSWLMLLAAFLAMVGIAAEVVYNTGKNWAGLAPEDSAPSGGLQGYLLAMLFIGVLGVLFVTGEYGTGMIRSTLAAVPRRVPVVVAKTLVFGGVALLAMVPASLAAYGTAQVFLSHYGHGTSLTDPGVLRVVLDTGVYLALLGLLGSAIGWMVRSTAGGISTFLGLVLVLPLLTGLLPGSISTVGEPGQHEPGAAVRRCCGHCPVG